MPPSDPPVVGTIGDVERSVEKAARNGVPFRRGYDPRRNVTTPGSGRPPNAIRAMLRDCFVDRLSVLRDIADGKAVRRVKVGENGEETELWVSPEPGDRIRAMDLLAKYGLGIQKDISIEGEVRHVEIRIRREGHGG